MSLQLENFIDHTLLKPTATSSDILQLCKEAEEHQFFAVCVNSCYVQLAVSALKNSKVKVAATIGFPLGAASTASKIAEAEKCVAEGAEEIDMVLNIGFLKDKKFSEVEEEISAIKEAIGDTILKVILETCYLSDEEITKACRLAENAKADFVKTSTGFGTAGATLEHVRLMKDSVSDKVKIKASGGIRDRETALEYIDLGVSRIGTSSGIQIVSV